MGKDLIAKTTTTIDAPGDKVWSALVDPAAIKEYMFGAKVESDWRVGSPITWKGEWKGKPFEDKGKLLEVQAGRTLKYTHFSPLMGKPDKPENYHTVTIELAPEGKRTRVSLAQDNNSTEEVRRESEKNWETMLEGLKKYVEH